MDLTVKSRRHVRQHDRFLSVADAQCQFSVAEFASFGLFTVHVMFRLTKNSDLSPKFPPGFRRVFGFLALRPNLGPPEAGVFRL